MEATEYLQLAAILLVRHIPLLVVAGLGLRFAVTRRQKLGRAYSSATWGFSLLMTYALASVALQVALTAIQVRGLSSGSRAELFTGLAMWNLAAYPLFIAGLAMLTRAVFLDRELRHNGSEPQQRKAASLSLA